MSIATFKRLCKACEQIERNEKKNADRAAAILKGRAANRAGSLRVPTTFIWINMNWRALVPILRALMTPDGRCQNCGHPFVNERDIQIEHHEPARFRGDWAREHARNLGLGCQACNTTKAAKPFAQWLDEQESARASNDRHRQDAAAPSLSEPATQLHLFRADQTDADRAAEQRTADGSDWRTQRAATGADARTAGGCHPNATVN